MTALIHELNDLWKITLSDEERDMLRKYVNSEKSVYLLKNKLTPSQVGLILDEVTKETCPFRSRIPNYLLVTMQTMSKTTQFMSSIATTATNWIPSVPSSTAWFAWGTPNTNPAKRHSFLSERPTLIVLKQSAVAPRIAPTGGGIDMMPVPISRHAKPVGIQIGPPMKPKQRIDFVVHNNTVWSRVGNILGSVMSF